MSHPYQTPPALTEGVIVATEELDWINTDELLVKWATDHAVAVEVVANHRGKAGTAGLGIRLYGRRYDVLRAVWSQWRTYDSDERIITSARCGNKFALQALRQGINDDQLNWFQRWSISSLEVEEFYADMNTLNTYQREIDARAEEAEELLG